MRNLKKGSSKSKAVTYLTLVRHIWDPYRKIQIESETEFKKRASKYVRVGSRSWKPKEGTIMMSEYFCIFNL